MSTAYQHGAAARPLRAPAPVTSPRRHLQPAPEVRSRRRPRLLHAVLTLGGIGVILLGQLLLSIALAEGTYRISDLQAQQIELSRQEHALTEALEVASSTQNLIAHASALGMVASGSPVFLDLRSGSATGSAAPAGPGAANGNLIGNALVDPAAAQQFAADAQQQQQQQGDGATPPPGGAQSGGGSSSGLLPSPTTH